MKKRFLNVLAVLLFILLIVPLSVEAQENEAFKKEHFIKNSDTLNYRILFPKDFSEEKQYPVVLFLHGAGERGSNNQSQLTHGSDLFLKNQDEFPAIVIFPQAPKEDYWAKVEVKRDTIPFQFDFMNEKPATKSLQLVMDLMDEMTSKTYVNKDRIYVGGLSMGGMGTFEIIYKKPEMFAAAFAICGGANPEIAKEYPEGFNIWLFHGKKDDVVLPRYSEAMARSINHYGGNAKLSLYPDDNHNSWDSAFAEPNLLPWLFSHSLENENGK
ncbi:carboxylesterase family protein [Salegentibacter mishustinae]|uniref:Phospholipase n=1 Tax=Salegentibacter mishustinae TaxID=270918 RepID=A0A0Q9ZC50_9FLAO|nr:prolyl oligopeptidase family serine peptidase [Salegentibacter mishustinae]KRG30671.1 phospholipase [Salegentibacter mishustinae]PNW23559.1 phospholipase [Salegentibacter mishustinae]PZX66641.1 phospholipase/carboxylesterase [Salegentibacter mishustinae]GGW83644.1 phospholipase [Salegentibacter mishustinae]